MKCSFCLREFDDRQAQQACKGCLVGGGCQKVKCPYCGYEMPREPRWLQRLLRRSNKP